MRPPFWDDCLLFSNHKTSKIKVLWTKMVIWPGWFNGGTGSCDAQRKWAATESKLVQHIATIVPKDTISQGIHLWYTHLHLPLKSTKRKQEKTYLILWGSENLCDYFTSDFFFPGDLYGNKLHVSMFSCDAKKQVPVQYVIVSILGEQHQKIHWTWEL